MSKTTIPTGGITADAINGTLIADDAINSEHYTDGSIDTAHVADSQITSAKTSGVGITAASQWRLTSNFAGDGLITANLSEVTNYSSDTLGSSMTQSSGVFTFPSTGYWYVGFRMRFYPNNSGSDCLGIIENQSGNDMAYANAHSEGTSGTRRFDHYTSAIFDVTDTSSVTCQFRIAQGDNSNSIEGSSTVNTTYFEFIRLGDT